MLNLINTFIIDIMGPFYIIKIRGLWMNVNDINTLIVDIRGQEIDVKPHKYIHNQNQGFRDEC